MSSETAGWCSVPGCPCPQYEVYHSFPKKATLQDMWLRVIMPPNRKKMVSLGNGARVCSLHFNQELDYETIKDGNLTLHTLKATAIPSIFPWSETWPFAKKTNKQKWLVESQPKMKVESPKPQQYFCESCDFSTINKGNLTRHEKNHGAILPHRCNLCDYACCDKHNLANHVSRHHINETGVTGAAMPVKKEKKSSNTNPSYVATGRKVPRRAGHSQKPIRQVVLDGDSCSSKVVSSGESSLADTESSSDESSSESSLSSSDSSSSKKSIKESSFVNRATKKDSSLLENDKKLSLNTCVRLERLEPSSLLNCSMKKESGFFKNDEKLSLKTCVRLERLQLSSDVVVEPDNDSSSDEETGCVDLNEY